jgi:hypothetical protein
VSLRRILALLLALSVACSVFLAWKWQRAEHTVREARKLTAFVLDSVGTTVSFPRPTDELAQTDSLYWMWVATLAQLQSRRWQQAIRHTWLMKRTLLEPEDLVQLMKAGLTDPARQIRDSLAAHPELIPYPGVLGGTMRVTPDEVVILSTDLVWAPFDDGHVLGEMLLEYNVIPGGRITWKRVWARQD